MVMKLEDPRTQQALADAVGQNDTAALERFVTSLELPADEEQEVMRFIRALPDMEPDSPDFPVQPPKMDHHAWWA